MKEILDSAGVEYIQRYREGFLEFDFFIPSCKVGIETHGNYWHSYRKKDFDLGLVDKERHKKKAIKAVEKGYKLFQFFESEIITKPEIVEDMILVNLGFAKKVFARECKVIELGKEEFLDFLGKNHLYSPVLCRYKFGLVSGKELVAVVGINKTKYGYEIKRIASKRKKVVIGGISKILKFFIKKYKPEGPIRSFLDARFSSPRKNVLQAIGFDFVQWTPPNYYYIHPKERVTFLRRELFQKHKLKNILEKFDPQKSEIENVLTNGYWIIFDAGHLLYEKIQFKEKNRLGQD